MFTVVHLCSLYALLIHYLQAFGSSFEQTLLDMVSLYSSSTNSSSSTNLSLLILAVLMAVVAVAATLWYMHQ
jgi:heme/copper-type cytochrome/quinol oxidase subunit 4